MRLMCSSASTTLVNIITQFTTSCLGHRGSTNLPLQICFNSTVHKAQFSVFEKGA